MRVRLNIISHFLGQIPYKDITDKEEVKLPKRGRIGKYKGKEYPFRMVTERF